jgi:flavodoxin
MPKKILIVYGTASGNTQWVVKYVAESLVEMKFDVKVERCEVSNPSSISEYDLIILASPTYNVGKLQENFEEYYNEFIKLKFPLKKFALIALGNSKMYDIFGGAKDYLEKGVKQVEGELILPTLMIDGGVYEREEEWKNYGLAIGKTLNGTI